MENKLEPESRFMCDLTAMDAEQRKQYQGVIEQLQKAFQGVEEIQDGYAFRYNSDSSTLLLITEFISMERLCCPFLDFTLFVEHERGPVWLRLTEPEGVKQFLRTELSFN